MPASLILSAVFGDMILAAAALGSVGLAAATFAINFTISAIVSKALMPGGNTKSQDAGTRQQMPPATTNSIPMVYGDAYLGGTFVDAVLTYDQKTMYYVLAISSISENSAFTPSTASFSFDQTKMYWGDRLITFDSTDKTKVIGLTDGAGNYVSQSDIYINLYTSTQDGVITSANGASLPSVVMGSTNVPALQRWPSSGRQMNGLAFAIVKLNYNQKKGITSMQPLTFRVSQYLNGAGKALPGDVWYDYITSTIYGGGMSSALVDRNSAIALNTYSSQTIAFTPSGGGSSTQTRYLINGVVDTGANVIENINNIMTACDSWNQYNAASGQWAVVINQAGSSTFAFDDSNLIGEIKTSVIDITNSINQVEVQFPSKLNRDQLDIVYLQTPSGLLYANEPINKYSCTFDLVNDSVQATYLANRMLEQAREDLIVTITAAYPAIQVDAGDIVSLTNSSYGWSSKLFRVMKVSEASLPDGNLGASLDLNEYNATVYDDGSITAFTPAGNTNLPNPASFGTLPAPTITASYPDAAVPSIVIQPYIGTASFVTYAEIWYSAFAAPTASQRYLLKSSAIPSDGTPYVVGETLPTVTISDLDGGNWYFFSRLVNEVATSDYSPASTLLQWRPTTFQYVDRYLNVRYGTDLTGSGFSTSPVGKTHYGLLNSSSTAGSSTPADYIWYLSPVAFGTTNYLLYANRNNRKFSFSAGTADYANATGAFVPTLTTVYDRSLWLGLPATVNYIDLDARTGQLTSTGTSSISSADGLLSISNNTSGNMVVSLAQFLNFGSGVYTKTAAISTLTIDIYGRVVGFTSPDAFYYTESIFTATAGQTSFSVTHIVGAVLVFRNGSLLDLADYLETTSTVVLANACITGEIVTVINMRAVSTSIFYETNNITIASSGTSTVTYTNAPWQIINAGDQLCFSNTGTPTLYTVQSINTSTKVITFTTTITGATAGLTIYRYRAAGATYAPFSRYTVDVSAISSYAPTTWSINSGFEQPFINGAGFNEIDYDITAGAFTGFPANMSGKFTIIQYAQNNFGVPGSNIVNTITYSVATQLTYTYPSNPLSMEIYANGVLLSKSGDYSATSSNYLLSSAFQNSSTILAQQTFARDGAA